MVAINMVLHNIGYVIRVLGGNCYQVYCRCCRVVGRLNLDGCVLLGGHLLSMFLVKCATVGGC